MFADPMKLFRLVKCLVPAVFMALASLPIFAATDAASYRVYFGTYTGQKSKGIYVSDRKSVV